MKNLKEKYNMDKARLYFLLFVVHSIAEKYKLAPRKVYNILRKTNVIDEYIIGCYDVAHSMGKISIISDIEEYLGNRGIKIC